MGIQKHTFVPQSSDIVRVLSLPRRDWTQGAEELAIRCTDALRTERACAGCGQQRGEHFRVPQHMGDARAPIGPDGLKPCPLKRVPLSLFTHQAAGLVNVAWSSGGMFPIGVGRGKTLFGFCIVTVLESIRPLLVLQAGLIEKAKRNLLELSLYWRIPNWIKIISYEVLGRVSGRLELIKYQPDLIIFDEVHKIKSRKAAVTKRVERYVMHHHTHALPSLASAGPLPYHGNPLPTPADLRAPAPAMSVAPVAANDGGAAHAHDRTCELCKDRITPKGFGPHGLRVVGMSGTITTQTPKDFAHIAHMCLPGGAAPVPSTFVELERWHLALGASVSELSRIEPGALLQFCDARESGLETMRAARQGFARRLHETPGIVGTQDDGVRASLQITPHYAPASAAIDDAFAMLRGDKTRCQVNWDFESLAKGDPKYIGDPRYAGWRLPDGFELVDGVEVYRHALELALGFYYVWDPRPPAEWFEARLYWKRFVRGQIKLGQLDSELEVANAAHAIVCTIDDIRFRAGDAPHVNVAIGKAHPYDHWVAIRDRYPRAKKAVWVCDSVLKDGEAWLHSQQRGILWTAHVAFGQALSQMSGVPYFGEQGRDPRGNYIDDANGPIIASLKANETGRDLQFKWDQNLFMTAMADGAENQQALARTHRIGQDADVVGAAYFMACIEHAIAFESAQNRARYIEDMMRERQRLNFADVLIPSASEQFEKQGTGTALLRWDKFS